MSATSEVTHLISHVETRIADLRRDIGHYQFSDEEHAQQSLARLDRKLRRLELHRAVVGRLHRPEALMPEYMRARGLVP